jgi:hypothetical protein
MKLTAFPKTIFCLALLLLGGLSAPVAAQELRVRKIDVMHQTVEVLHADGSISSAEFLSEMILLPDGRANGGWGMWERGTPDVLTLYRVVEGRVSFDGRRGPFFEFKAQRLSPLPGDEITISLHPAGGGTPTGAVTFRVDGAGDTFSFEAKGKVLQLPPDSSADFNLGYISAPPQTVVVQTLRGSYTANFANVALVFPSVGAIGLLELTAPGGELVHYGAFDGRGIYRSTDSGHTWVQVTLQLRRLGAPPQEEAAIAIIRPAPAPAQECLIYDLLGTEVHAHFEAQGVFSLFATE